jgi:hypothetical protein
MFNNQYQFYPTPKKLAQRMVRPYLEVNFGERKFFNKDLKILDPSAGSGILLEAVYDIYLEKVYDWGKDKIRKEWKRDVFACEIQEDLQHILIGKGVNIITSDFLQLETSRRFDLIVMNPPFSNGAKHILHAWKFIDEGNIVALVNSETLKNPYDKNRKLLLKLIEDNKGTVEHVGEVFQDADRSTKVKVSIIRINKKNHSKFSLFDDKEFSKSNLNNPVNGDLSDTKNELAKRDIIGNLIIRYQEAINHYVMYKRSERKMKILEDQFDWEDSYLKAAYSKGQFHTDESLNNRKKHDRESYDTYLSELTAAAWRTVIRLTGFKERMTSRVLKEFENNIQGVKTMEFTRDNIVKLLDLLVQSRTQIIENCILDAYDELTKYHKNNRVHVEGWKTNEAYKVKRKVIIPCAVEYWDSGSWYLTEKMRGGIVSDLDKAMCFLDGKRIEDILTIGRAVKNKAIENKENGAFGSSDTYCESTFFKMRFFMKGTIHMTFKNKKLHDQFNLFVARKRGWLPGAN